MPVSAVILGCADPALTPEERAFFRDADPWGFILFRRNIGTPQEVRALTAALREAVGREAPVLVDQEGGRVQRLGPPHWPKYPPGRHYGRVHANDPVTRREITRLAARLIAHDLTTVGINVDCIPVLDVPAPGSHEIVGDRAYGADAVTVGTLGRAAAEGLLAGGVLPVIKHVPGHGRATVDSHLTLPVVDAPLAELEASDFLPFRMLSDMPIGMSAHVVYTAIDPAAPCTTSRTVIRRVVRGAIGYDGLLVSDDLSMQALAGSLGERAAAAFAAGCDVGLHCNGRMEEMLQVMDAAPRLAGKARRRAEAALARIRHLPEPVDVAEARARLDAALATLQAA
ncbi:beta-N-acetylhexosaminidase [Labrys wisconsinensis]|uniref:beta-N-acetylhexosaminidase n=1 Tax=Labrys wisconsinensis TaxID=425677 RepID=A0ABU0J6D8_9HYPH|nr:beta-N-acetylhexosaminidase [Labrys wisconsinensis]MDQ0468767.1 beta-N-acetylhexosaminidase [Labrys wisconsinensis]